MQADVSTSLNQTQLRFSVQSLNASGAGFGQLNQAAPPRQVQLGIGVTF